MTEPHEPSPDPMPRLRDWWRGLWGRGDDHPSSRQQSRLAHQLHVENRAEVPDERGCAICAARARSCHDWLNDLPITPARPAAPPPVAPLPYCPRHLRLLMQAEDGQRHLRAVLPEILAAAHHAVLTCAASPERMTVHAGCSGCTHEDQIETQAVHAAAQLPSFGTTTAPDVTQLELCQDHTLLVAARIVGRLGPEPRAIPDLHRLLANHRRRLRHLVARDGAHSQQLGRALVVVADAEAEADVDAAATRPSSGTTPPAPASHRCTVCAAAADETCALLEVTARRLADRAARSHQHQGESRDGDRDVRLCRAHVRDLLNHTRRPDHSDDPAVLASIARERLSELAPALDWLDSGFAHPHTIRHTIAELTGPRPCPACATYAEGQRHALAALTAQADLPHTIDDPVPAVCLRHSVQLRPDHPAQTALAAALRAAQAYLQDLPAQHPTLAAPAAGVPPQPARPGPASLPPPLLVHALGLLDGRVHYDTAGAADDPVS